VTTEAVVLERLQGMRGELVLRRIGEHYEVISNGTFLMDTRNGQSERLLVNAALRRSKSPAVVLIGGLGVGYSLVAALLDNRVSRVVVVEIEPAIRDWHRTHLAGFTSRALHDERSEIVIDDLLGYLRESDQRYDVICLDIDNGPDWTVTPDNAALYGEDGTAVVTSRLAAEGVLSVWSAARSPSYETVLRHHFERVEVLEIEVPRGERDVVVVATCPRGVRR
jgi:spermidine synthase